MTPFFLRSLLWISITAAIVILICRSLTPHKIKLTLVASLYILLIVIFANIYAHIYSKDHSRFVFSSDILRTRQAELLDSRAHEIDRLQNLYNAILQLADRLQDKRLDVQVLSTDDSFVNLKTADYKYEFSFDPTWSGITEGRAFRGARVTIFNKTGSIVGSEHVFITGPDLSLQKTLPTKQWDAIIESFFPPKTTDKFQEMIIPLKTRLENSLADLQLKLTGLNAVRTKEWGYLDFLYFSTITQTTVGYGDILPNSSTVRFCVMVQVFLGLFLIGIVISWITPDGRKRSEIQFPSKKNG